MKYHSKKVVKDGKTFDSKKEYRRYCELSMLEKAGIITDLKTQVPFELVPAHYEFFERYGKSGNRIADGSRCIERAVVYRADFVYKQNGERVVEDTKSPATRTKDYIIKRKLMLHVHNIKIKEV